MNLYEKLNVIMQGMGTIEKKGYNSFHKYSYIRQADLVEKLQALCIQHKVVVMYSCEDGETRQVGDQLLSTVRVKYTFINAENPEERFEAFSIGDGVDKGDKGIYKAITGADKYMFRNTFLVGSEEDAEKDSPEIKRRRVKKTPDSIM